MIDTEPNSDLVDALVTLLCQKSATHSQLFTVVARKMEERGYCLTAEQQGVFRTYIYVLQVED